VLWMRGLGTYDSCYRLEASARGWGCWA
jgi:hypothetical protein